MLVSKKSMEASSQIFETVGNCSVLLLTYVFSSFQAGATLPGFKTLNENKEYYLQGNESE